MHTQPTKYSCEQHKGTYARGCARHTYTRACREAKPKPEVTHLKNLAVMHDLLATARFAQILWIPHFACAHQHNENKRGGGQEKKKMTFCDPTQTQTQKHKHALTK